MEHSFWHNKWEKQEIGFHLSEVNPLLIRYFSNLVLSPNSRVFVPLCGKTLDIHWLLNQGYNVVGAELSQLAIEQLFAALQIIPDITNIGPLKRYTGPNIEIFVGDIFNLSAEILGHVDAIYDRAALIALPKPVRDRYTQHLMQLTNTAPQLLICVEYDQTLMDGPPFSITPTEVEQHYQQSYQIDMLSNEEVKGGLKGGTPGTQHVWLLQEKQ